ncbi:WXG100 family type VII secretion target [Mycobacteroides franklinii]|uniref:Uncharacterized protein n=1 Tax=Mycobacteroides franklinii TaxID=948102 RepID=A0A4R8RCK3_9MYCO|nr:WXG100 family type VII secretion target [Mycobacteroides franklinii]TDZ43953.1 hypothetical protein CCUG64054_04018 [Mycobacteroides franklinii]TDZ51087.1 hypothetical protein CCUG63697_02603 [Mycobacteroides franklinii]TDZ57507.1 hypothetical protein CCUG63696_04014 [Mycobacteroides franklinii]TDZ64449.1 hypothetical protein CCUG63695_03945 [Mycobacteroides franklinii]TDZ70846.1 hypothetical protein CCUG64056_04018 [Mycobacteroides franklinii]
MSLTLGELKKVSVQSIRDISTGLHAKAAALRSTKAGVSDLPHKGTWTGVAADNADHEIGQFGKGLGTDADAYEDAAKKADRAGDEFEGLKQLLAKLENEASGKFSINESTGEVTPLSKDCNKSDRDYIANTIKQLCAAGGQANDDLAAAIHATDGATTPASASAPGSLAPMPGSAIKPDGVAGGIQNLAAPNPDGDPGATKAAAATGADTEAKYKEWYPKNGVSVGDKNVDPSKLGGVGALPGVGNIDKATPAKLAPTLADRDVPAFKDVTRQNLINARVPADQIEQRVNDAVTRAQTPHFAPDGGPMRSPGEVPLHNSAGDQFNDIVGRANDSATKTIDGQIEQAKVLTGQAGPGAPGVADAWKDVGLGAAKQVHELMTDPLAAPKMGIQEAQDFYNHPGESIGKNIILGTEGLATGAVGGEAAAGARGLLGDLTGTEGHAITHGLESPHPGPAIDHTPAGSVDHPSPGVGLGHPTPNPGSWNHSIEHYSPQAPQLAADLNNAFTNGHPTADLAGQVADHATHHAPGIGSGANPDRVVLGKWAGDDAGYIGEARHNGGIYYDTGGDAWNAIGNGLSRSDADALGWQVNEQFLKTQMENGIPRIDYVTEGTKFSGIADVLRMDPNSFSAKEIKYLIENAPTYGYQRIGDSWVRAGGQ